MILTDADHIRNLLADYCTLVDSGDFDGVGELMADAVLGAVDGPDLARGRDEIADFYRRIVKIPGDGTRRTPGTQHVVSNVWFGQPEADDTVEVRSSFTVLQAVDGLALQPVMTGRYVDRFGKNPYGVWRFVSRRFAAGLTGDLSHHMEMKLS